MVNACIPEESAVRLYWWRYHPLCDARHSAVVVRFKLSLSDVTIVCGQLLVHRCHCQVATVGAMLNWHLDRFLWLNPIQWHPHHQLPEEQWIVFLNVDICAQISSQPAGNFLQCSAAL